MTYKKFIVPASLLAMLTAVALQPAVADPATDVVAKHDADNDKTLDLNEVETAAADHDGTLSADELNSKNGAALRRLID